MMTAAKWARAARSDYEASKHALAAGDFPHAVFWLQQSAEKAVKALILTLKPDATEEDLRRYGHQPSEFTREVLCKLAAAEEREAKALMRHAHFAQAAMFQSPTGFADASGTLARFEAALSQNETPVALTTDAIAQKLAIAEHVEASVRNPSDEEVSKWAHEQKGPARQRFISGKAQKGDTKVLNVEAARSAYVDQFEGYVAIIRLESMAFLLHPHAEAPRYGWQGSSPEELYTREHPVVAALPVLLEYHDGALNALDRQVEAATRPPLG